jgi:exodeoxyribonuclease V alpha subunit
MENAEPNPLHRHFAALLQRIAPVASPELRLAAELLSKWQSDGHVCVPLAEITGADMQEAGLGESLPELWPEKLRTSGVVGAGGEFKPLILDESARLYLQRYWQYETAVVREIQRRTRAEGSGDLDRVQAQVTALFGRDADLQKLAAIMAATSLLTVISGAPGTGKTHTIVMICALLLALESEIEIALAAPTGKAAARLKEALGQARSHLPWPAEILERLPTEAATIQRLLGAHTDSAHFRHKAVNPLSADVVIVDEASMIDLALLAKLLDAVRPEARLILVGDKDQLASVEAGSAFRDICTPGLTIGLSVSAARKFETIPRRRLVSERPRVPIHDAVVELRENFRFAKGSGVAELSAAVNAGDAKAACEILKKGEALKWRSTPTATKFQRALQSRVRDRFFALTQETDVAVALKKLSEFTVLCALRRGPFGAETVNRMMARMLYEGSEPDVGMFCFAGQPLMIVRNDYDSGLFNGDIGIVLPAKDGKLRAFFPGDRGSVRHFALARLPEHEPAFALTVHKSQGSEFEECLVILPDRDSRLLTRELLYTAITRVRKKVEVWASESVLSAAISRQVRRSSGLRDALWRERHHSNLR